jgi:hypothetical protein
LNEVKKCFTIFKNPSVIPMSILRQYVAPLLIVLVFLVALVAVSSRIFLAEDMAAPAPIDEMVSLRSSTPYFAKAASLPPSLAALMTGMTDDSTLP